MRSRRSGAGPQARPRGSESSVSISYGNFKRTEGYSKPLEFQKWRIRALWAVLIVGILCALSVWQYLQALSILPGFIQRKIALSYQLFNTAQNHVSSDPHIDIYLRCDSKLALSDFLASIDTQTGISSPRIFLSQRKSQPKFAQIPNRVIQKHESDTFISSPAQRLSAIILDPLVSNNSESYILFLDNCETFTTPTALHILLKKLSTTADLDFVYADYLVAESKHLSNLNEYNAYEIWSRWLTMGSLDYGDDADDERQVEVPLTTSMLIKRNPKHDLRLQNVISKFLDFDRMGTVERFWVEWAACGFRGGRVGLPLLGINTDGIIEDVYSIARMKISIFHSPLSPSTPSPSSRRNVPFRARPNIRDIFQKHGWTQSFIFDMKRNHSPLVSIIIPFYNMNNESWFKTCIASVQNQSFADLEIILVNDGTDDRAALRILNSVSLWAELGLPTRNGRVPFRVLQHSQNYGLSSARNTGVLNSRGSFVLFLDADDKMADLAVEKLVLLGLQVLDRPFKRVKGHWGGVVYPGVHHFENKQELVFWDYSVDSLGRENSLTSFGLVSRHKYIEIGGNCPREKIDGYEDWDFWLRMAALGGRGVLLHEGLFWYRRHDMGNSAKIQEHLSNLKMDGAQEMRRNNPVAFGDMTLEQGKSILRQRIREGFQGSDSYKFMQCHTRIKETPQELQILAMHKKLFPSIPFQSRIPVPATTSPHILPLPFNPNTDKKAMLYIIPWMVMGGAELYDLHVIKTLRKIGWTVTLVTTRNIAHQSWLLDFQKEGVSIFHLQDLANTSEARNWVLDTLVETRGVRLVVIGRSVDGYEAIERWNQYRREKRLGFDRILFVDIIHLYTGDRREWEWRSGRAARYVDARVIVSRDLKAYMVGVVRNGDEVLGVAGDRTWRREELSREDVEKLKVIYPPLVVSLPAIEFENMAFDETPIMVFLGRFDTQKNPMLWLNIALKVLESNQLSIKPKFRMYGSGPLGNRISEFLESHPALARQIEVRGLDHSEVLVALKSSGNMLPNSVIVMTSGYEGMPISVLEGLSACIHIVGFDCGGIGEIGEVLGESRDWEDPTINESFDAFNGSSGKVKRFPLLTLVGPQKCDAIARDLKQSKTKTSVYEEIFVKEVNAVLSLQIQQGKAGIVERCRIGDRVKAQFSVDRFQEKWAELINGVV